LLDRLTQLVAFCYLNPFIHLNFATTSNDTHDTRRPVTAKKNTENSR
jgi:hypothetical protein